MMMIVISRLHRNSTGLAGGTARTGSLKKRGGGGGGGTWSDRKTKQIEAKCKQTTVKGFNCLTQS